MVNDRRKQSLYIDDDLLKEIAAEAIRQDRSLSWIVQRAWKFAREKLREYPSADSLTGGPPKGE